MIRAQQWTNDFIFGKMGSTVSKVAPVVNGYFIASNHKAITLCHQAGKGNQTIGHLRLTLPDLKFKVSPMVKEVFKWLKHPKNFQSRNLPK